MVKQMIKNVLYYSFIMCVLVCMPYNSVAQHAPPEDAKKKAQLFLDKLIPKLSGGELSGYIDPGDNLNNLAIGNSYKCYHINSNKLKIMSDSESLESCLEFKMWTFLVMHSDDIRLQIHIKNKNGEWQVAGFGKPYSGIYEANKIMTNGEKYSYSVVKYPGKYSFIFIKNETENEIQVRPMTEALHKVFGSDGNSKSAFIKMKSEDVVNILKENEY